MNKTDNEIVTDNKILLKMNKKNIKITLENWTHCCDKKLTDEVLQILMSVDRFFFGPTAHK